jgi:hypothetical protein
MLQGMSTDTTKAKVSEAADCRERTIRYLMSEEGTRFYGGRIPRWKAEQMVAPPGSYELTKRRSDEECERKRQLYKKLHDSNRYIGQAFDKVCKAGCDAKWLELVLLTVAHYPLKRSHAIYGAEDKRRLERLIAKLESAARELEKFDPMMVLSPVDEWPAPPEHLPTLLRGVAYCLREGASRSNKWFNLRRATAAFRVPYLIRQVARQTGRPHYAEMATLIGAAYGRPDYSESDLKMLVSRANASERRRHRPR